MICPGSIPAGGSPRIVTECLLTRLMLLKMYVHDIYKAGAILSIRKYEYDFITTVTIYPIHCKMSMVTLFQL